MGLVQGRGWLRGNGKGKGKGRIVGERGSASSTAWLLFLPSLHDTDRVRNCAGLAFGLSDRCTI